MGLPKFTLFRSGNFWAATSEPIFSEDPWKPSHLNSWKISSSYWDSNLVSPLTSLNGSKISVAVLRLCLLWLPKWTTSGAWWRWELSTVQKPFHDAEIVHYISEEEILQWRVKVTFRTSCKVQWDDTFFERSVGLQMSRKCDQRSGYFISQRNEFPLLVHSNNFFALIIHEGVAAYFSKVMIFAHSILSSKTTSYCMRGECTFLNIWHFSFIPTTLWCFLSLSIVAWMSICG